MKTEAINLYRGNDLLKTIKVGDSQDYCPLYLELDIFTNEEIRSLKDNLMDYNGWEFEDNELMNEDAKGYHLAFEIGEISIKVETFSLYFEKMSIVKLT